MVGNPNSPITQRLLDEYERIIGNPGEVDTVFLHTVLAQCGLPYRNPPDGAINYIKRVGYAEMAVEAGLLQNPDTKEWERQGLPFGPKPRLLLINLCSQAVKKQSRHLEVADSMTAFMRELGITVSGGKRGSIASMKKQLNRLVAAKITLSMDYPHSGITTIPSVNPIKKFDVWFPDSPDQKVLWASEVTLDYDFFTSLMDHAVPMNMNAIRALQHNTRALDIYLWLTYRLPQLKRDTPITWLGLQDQFGSPTNSSNSFRRDFRAAMRQVLLVYPEARVEDDYGGIIIKNSPPSIPKTTSVQITRG